MSFKTTKTVWIICILFFSLMFFTGLTQKQFHGNEYSNGTSDYATHFNRARQLDLRETPLAYLLAFSFAFKEPVFFFYTLLWAAFIIPLLLFWLVKNELIVWFYFTIASFPFLQEIGGHLTTMMAVALLLLMLGTKNNFYRLALLGLSFFVHGYAPYLVLGIWGVLLLFENKDFKTKLLGCFSGTIIPQELKPAIMKTNITLLSGISINIGYVLSFFVKEFPFPFILLSLKGMLAKKQFHLIGLTLMLFCLSAFHLRALQVTQIPLLIGLTYFCETNNNKWLAKSILIASLLVFAFHFYSFWWIRWNTFLPLDIC